MNQLLLPGIEPGGCVPPYIAAVLPSMGSTDTGYADDDGLVDEAEALFHGAGIEVLGSGAYSLVVPHTDEDKVVKLTLSEQDGYHQYLDWIKHSCPKHLRPHVPVIHETYVINGIRVTIMERLEGQDGSPCETTEELRELLGDEVPDGWRRDCSLDGMNIMQRADGTHVITDPWAHRQDYT